MTDFSAIRSFVASAVQWVQLWLGQGALVLPALAVAWIIHAAAFVVARRLTAAHAGSLSECLIRQIKAPARFVMLILAVQFALGSRLVIQAGWVRHGIAIGLIASVTWLAARAIAALEEAILIDHPLDVEDNLHARRIHTQARVLARILIFAVALVGFALILMTFPNVRQLGASLLASAGIVGLVTGLAARPVLGNLIAGLQLALTQPMRLDDVVIVEGEWGRIEEITLTYVVIRIWDERRLVVPLQYFIEHPFENWTRSSASLLGAVELFADYRVPVDMLRAELRRIVRQAKEWDGRVCVLQVTDVTERTVKLRALISAADSGRAWDLRCGVREALLTYLQREHPYCLPRLRMEQVVSPAKEVEISP
ncbi:MAG TPA: mechanosensitive ion channel domain-containing protein [Nitrococcus sp.]|nr:mechanosensitive ion channel domain-containing protein [Nitrococcus sp.]